MGLDAPFVVNDNDNSIMFIVILFGYAKLNDFGECKVTVSEQQ